MEAYAREVDFPIIGIAAGYFNYVVARMIGARKVFELGSGYGYSTAWFARAVKENGGGVVHHCVWDEDLSKRARGYLGRLGYADMIEFHVGEAIETLTKTDDTFDLMFNDIQKHMYPASIPVIKQKLRVGGVLLMDNMFLSGSIFGDNVTDQAPLGVVEVTRMLKEDPDWLFTIAPIRDGVALCYRAG
jgi:predicted O-methyltransferase YrrM